MIIFYLGVLLVLSGFWVSAKLIKPILPVTDISYSKPFLAPSALICNGMDKIRTRLFRGGKPVSRDIRNRKLAANLKTLYPGETEDSQYYRYRVEHISTMLLIIGIGAVLGLSIKFLAIDRGVLEDGDVIYRSEYGGTDVAADLTAGIKSKDDQILSEQNIEVTVPARIYSHEEADDLFEKMSLELDGIILGQNDSPEHVITDLNLVRAVDGYPFTINWECSDYGHVDTDGVVHNEELTEPVLVTVTADCVYEHEHWYTVETLSICPRELTEEEKIYEELTDAVDESNTATAALESMVLPKEISFGELEWTERIADNSPLMILLAALLCLLIGPVKENDVNKKIKDRAREMLIEYPAFISKLTLYMGAGMSVRNCFLKLGNDCLRVKEGKRSYLQKELTITAQELQMGIPETEAYEHFGKRCGSREYMRFSALLTQNLRKGSTDLLGLLKKESEDAFVLRKNEARKLGEEASTKLLLPMIMMLAVVMVIIMVPAYMSFSS